MPAYTLVTKDRELTDHFRLSDFFCSHCKGIADSAIPHVEALAWELDVNLWLPLGPVTITSGWRCAEHNSAVGGARASQHLVGTAADLKVKRGGEWMDAHWLAGWIEASIDLEAMPEGGIGTYRRYPSMLHYDIRGTRARWRK